MVVTESPISRESLRAGSRGHERFSFQLATARRVARQAQAHSAPGQLPSGAVHPQVMQNTQMQIQSLLDSLNRDRDDA
jgi:hypothetical protein